MYIARKTIGDPKVVVPVATRSRHRGNTGTTLASKHSRYWHWQEMGKGSVINFGVQGSTNCSYCISLVGQTLLK